MMAPAVRVGGGIVSLAVLALVAAVVLCIVWGILYLIGRSRRRSPDHTGTAPAMPLAVSSETRREGREEVLRKLASKELTREQAEGRLSQLDNPVPDALPTPPVRRSRWGLGCGCLVMLLLGILVLLWLAGMVFGVQVLPRYRLPV